MCILCCIPTSTRLAVYLCLYDVFLSKLNIISYHIMINILHEFIILQAFYFFVPLHLLLATLNILYAV